jgi:hypothetical protein
MIHILIKVATRFDKAMSKALIMFCKQPSHIPEMKLLKPFATDNLRGLSDWARQHLVPAIARFALNRSQPSARIH